MHMLRMSLAVALAGACAREAAPPQPPSNKAVALERSPAVTDPLAFLPIDADIVVGVDVRALRASALWAEYQPQLTRAIGPQLENVQRTCGFDPIQAVDSVALAAYSKETSSPVVVVRGLPRDRTTACLAAKVLPDTTVTDDHGVLSLSYKNGGGSMAAFADPATLVIQGEKPATPDGLRAVLRGGAPLRGSPAFVEMFKQIDHDAALWIVANGKAGLFDSFPGAHPDALYGTLRVTTGVAAKVHFRMAKPDDATQLAALFQAQIKQAASMVDRVDVAAEGSVVTITIEMSADKLRALTSMFMGLAGAVTSP